MQKNASSKISSNYIENYDLQLSLNLRTDNRTDAIESTKKSYKSKFCVFCILSDHLIQQSKKNNYIPLP